MNETIRYVNNLNEEVLLGQGSLHYQSTTIHDYVWEYTTVSSKVDQLKRNVREFELNICIEDGTIDMRNEIVDVMEYDVREGKPGTLYIGDWHLDAYCIKSEKSRWYFDEGVMSAKLTFVTDQSLWKRTTKHDYLPVDEEVAETGKMYPFGFQYDYAARHAVTQYLDVPGRHASNWRLVIYGAATSPAITVGDHLYKVNYTIEDGGYIVIDSERKTVMAVGRKGSITNIFNKQNKSSYIFEKLNPGTSKLSWDNTFGFQVQLEEERSEPEWA